MSVFKTGLLFMLMALPSSAGAQAGITSDNWEHSLQGKHRIELSVGFLSEVSVATEVTSGGVTIKSEASGVAAWIAYTYYFGNDFGVFTRLGVLDADAKTTVTGSTTIVESASVAPLLFGVKYEPSSLSFNADLRPYASLSIGPYIGSASNVRTGATTSTQSFTETALGSRIAVGIDVFIGRFITLDVGAGYHLVSDFKNRIGSEKNYSSPEFFLSFGVIFGG